MYHHIHLHPYTYYLMATGKPFNYFFHLLEGLSPQGFTLVICSLDNIFVPEMKKKVGQVLPVSCHPVQAALMLVD